MIKFNCEKCKQHYEVEKDLAGEEAECTKCGADISIPNAPEPEPELEPEKPQKLKMPARKPHHGEEKASEQKSGDNGNCPNCGAELPFANAVICTECGQNLRLGVNVNTLQSAKTAGKLGVAIAVGAATALLSGGIWAAITVWTKLEIGWIALLVGLITGFAVCLVTKERSARVGALAVALACIGMLTGKMLTAEYLIRDRFKDYDQISKEFVQKTDKQSQEKLLLDILQEEMLANGEITDPYNNEVLNKLAPKLNEKPSQEYKKEYQRFTQKVKLNQAKVKKRFKTLSAANKARLKNKQNRLPLTFILQQEIIESGEISKPDESWKSLAPKNSKEKPSEKYLASFNKYTIQTFTNFRKIKNKLYT